MLYWWELLELCSRSYFDLKANRLTDYWLTNWQIDRGWMNKLFYRGLISLIFICKGDCDYLCAVGCGNCRFPFDLQGMLLFNLWNNRNITRKVSCLCHVLAIAWAYVVWSHHSNFCITIILNSLYLSSEQKLADCWLLKTRILLDWAIMALMHLVSPLIYSIRTYL